MKKSLALVSTLFSFSVMAAAPQFNDITKKDVENISSEFGANFAHTAVAAPETDGIWGIEVGVVGGTTQSPEFKDVIDRSGGDGKEFDTIYHAGLMARAHFPFEIFVEASMLPEQEISDVKIQSSSFSLGWNVGRFANLPLDVAIGYDHGKGEVNFHQDADILSNILEADIDLKTTTKVMWVGVSKTFLFVTPYLKVGTSSVDGDLKADASIFDVGAKTEESVSLSSGYLALGANFQFFVFRLGIEATKMHDTSRLSGKLSLAF